MTSSGGLEREVVGSNSGKCTVEQTSQAFDLTSSVDPCFVHILQDVLQKLIAREGVFSLWKGFTPYYARLGPHTVLTFVFLEQFRILYYRAVVSS